MPQKKPDTAPLHPRTVSLISPKQLWTLCVTLHNQPHNDTSRFIFNALTADNQKLGAALEKMDSTANRQLKLLIKTEALSDKETYLLFHDLIHLNQSNAKRSTKRIHWISEQINKLFCHKIPASILYGDKENEKAAALNIPSARLLLGPETGRQLNQLVDCNTVNSSTLTTLLYDLHRLARDHSDARSTTIMEIRSKIQQLHNESFNPAALCGGSLSTLTFG